MTVFTSLVLGVGLVLVCLFGDFEGVKIMEPTQRQIELLTKIRGFIARKDYPPSNSEMAEMLGCGVTNIRELVRKLTNQRLVKVEKYKHRSIVVTEAGLKVIEESNGLKV